MGEPVNLMQLDAKEFDEFLDSFDHVFSDCDGVIWHGKPLPGSGDFFKLMEKLGKTVNFVSNNSLRSKENYEAMFQAAGIQNGFERLTIPSVAIAEYLKSVNFNKKVYSVCCPEAQKVIESYGFECVTGPNVGPDYYEDYAQFIIDNEEIGAVVFDCDFQINLPKMQRSITYLKRPDVLFLCGATDRNVYFKSRDTAILATGVFSEIVAEDAKREPILLGKPGRPFGEFAMRRAGVTDPSRVLFIGDMIEQDVGLGKATGFKTLLLLTNIKKEEMLAHKTIKPDFYADSLGKIIHSTPLFNKQ